MLTSAAQTFMDLAGVDAGVHLNGYNRNGWYVGGGVENSLNFFGINSPGWFMKTEYRSAFYERKTQSELDNSPTSRSWAGTTSAPTAGTRRSRPRWSIASTGAARASAGTDLV
ncbi:hypothetical protein ACVW1A_007125 [Bradyrhizobium sp. LB1.3]